MQQTPPSSGRGWSSARADRVRGAGRRGLLDYVGPIADEVADDAYGTPGGAEPGGDPRIVVTGHADELG